MNLRRLFCYEKKSFVVSASHFFTDICVLKDNDDDDDDDDLLIFSLKFADPYLNIDAGTMSPFEHGEVFVLDDGGEVSSLSLFTETKEGLS